MKQLHISSRPGTSALNGIHYEITMYLWDHGGQYTVMRVEGQNCLLVTKEGKALLYLFEAKTSHMRVWYDCVNGKVNLFLIDQTNQLKRSWKKTKASNPRTSLFPCTFFSNVHPFLHHHFIIQTIFRVFTHVEIRKSFVKESFIKPSCMHMRINPLTSHQAMC